MQSVYNGKSVIVVSESTPFCIDYIMKTQHACVSFYIQRYTAEDYPLDSSLQALMNHNYLSRTKRQIIVVCKFLQFSI